MVRGEQDATGWGKTPNYLHVHACTHTHTHTRALREGRRAALPGPRSTQTLHVLRGHEKAPAYTQRTRASSLSKAPERRTVWAHTRLSSSLASAPRRDKVSTFCLTRFGSEKKRQNAVFCSTQPEGNQDGPRSPRPGPYEQHRNPITSALVPALVFGRQKRQAKPVAWG